MSDPIWCDDQGQRVATPPTYYAEWDMSGACLQSIEDVTYGQGRLGPDYTDNVDTRWPETACLGMLLNTVDCGAAAGTAANANSLALANGLNSTLYFYVARGTKWAKIQASNMTLISDGSETATAARVWRLLYTKDAAGVEEISVFLISGAYQVIKAVSTGATDTFDANNESKVYRTANYAWPGNTIIAVGGQTLSHNVLTGTVSMDDSAWQDRTTLTGPPMTIYDVLMDDDKVILMGTEGPVYWDNDFQEYRIGIPEIAASDLNCAASTTWYEMGIVFALARSLRIWRSGRGQRVGPETYPFNTGQAQGYFTALWGSERWLYGALRNPTEGTSGVTRIMAARPPEPGEAYQDKILVWYTLATLGDGVDCEFLKDIETYGGRTNPTMVGGYEDDVLWWTQGRIKQEIDDANYRFAPSGDWYGTEMRRLPRINKWPVCVEFETEDCASGKTVTVSVSPDGGSYQSLTSSVTTNGLQRVEWDPEELGMYGRRLKPKVSFATDASTTSPRMIGKLRIGYRCALADVDGAVHG